MMLPPWMAEKILREKADRESHARVPLYRPPPPPPSRYDEEPERSSKEDRGSYTF